MFFTFSTRLTSANFLVFFALPMAATFNQTFTKTYAKESLRRQRKLADGDLKDEEAGRHCSDSKQRRNKRRVDM